MSEHFPFSGDVVPANSPGRKTVGQMMRPTTAIEPGAHLAAAAYLIKLAVLRSPQRSLGHYPIMHTQCPHCELRVYLEQRIGEHLSNEHRQPLCRYGVLIGRRFR